MFYSHRYRIQGNLPLDTKHLSQLFCSHPKGSSYHFITLSEYRTSLQGLPNFDGFTMTGLVSTTLPFLALPIGTCLRVRGYPSRSATLHSRLAAYLPWRPFEMHPRLLVGGFGRFLTLRTRCTEAPSAYANPLRKGSAGAAGGGYAVRSS